MEKPILHFKFFNWYIIVSMTQLTYTCTFFSHKPCNTCFTEKLTKFNFSCCSELINVVLVLPKFYYIYTFML